MELFGLLIAAPVAFVASLGYATLLLAIFNFLPVLGRVLVVTSLGVVTVIAVELVFLTTIGAKGTYARLGHWFTAMHFLGFFLAPPAVANLVFHFASRRNLKKWVTVLAATACCWAACMTALLGHIEVDERIVGTDAEKPFYMTSPREQN